MLLSNINCKASVTNLVENVTFIAVAYLEELLFIVCVSYCVYSSTMHACCTLGLESITVNVCHWASSCLTTAPMAQWLSHRLMGW